jgi:hypothetical protein
MPTGRVNVLALTIVLLVASVARSGQPAPVGPEFAVNSYTTSAQHPGAVAADAAGNLVSVYWSAGQDGSGFGIFGRRFNRFGVPQGTEFQVNTYTTDSQQSPDVAVDGFGNFLVVWEDFSRDGSSFGIFGRRYSGGGVPLGSDFQVNTYTPNQQRNPAVSAKGFDGFVVVWESYTQDGSGNGVFGRRYDSTGTALGGEFAVNSYTSSSQADPSVTGGSSDFIVTWDSFGQDGDQHDVFARRFVGGAPQAAEFRVNTYTTGQQAEPRIARQANGDFVIVWSGPDGANDGIFGQRLAAGGTLQGAEFQVNTYTTGTQNNVDVDVDGGGNFTVVWNSTGGEDGAGWSVLGRRYDATGVAQGPPFQVNTYTTSDQNEPSIVTAGNFVVAWDSYGQDGSNSGVFAQRFEVPVPISGKKLVIADPGDPARRKIVFKTKDPLLDTTAGPGIDPVHQGASFQVYNNNGSGDSMCASLPGGSWFAKGDAAGSPSFSYGDGDFSNGPCKVSKVRDAAFLKVVCLARVMPISYSLDEATQVSVAVRFSSGATTYCTVFGGTILKDEQNGKFIAVDAPSPVACPAPPTACP